MSSPALLLLGLLSALSTAPPPTVDAATLEAAPSGAAALTAEPTFRQDAEDPVRVFLDCQTTGCDFDFFRTELTWVDWVRDRQDADVHVMVTSQTTGGGGRLYDMSFEGRRDFAGEGTFTLTHASSADETTDDRRHGILRTLSFGLVRFASESSVADRLQVNFTEAPEAAELGAEEPGEVEAPEDDPWNLWVFSTSLRASMNGESSSGSQNYNGSLSATRTTEDWRIRVSASGNYRESRFELPDRTVRSIRRSYSGSGLLARSVSARTTGGIRASARSSTFQNEDLSLEIGPAFEVSLFPYEESTRRALTFEYWTGVNHFDYTEETIFEKEKESLAQHRATVSLSLRQPWGTINTRVDGSQYLHDLSLTQLSLNTGLNLRLFRGFSLNVNGSYARIRDQLNLPRGDATDDEILTQQLQLATDYRYFASFGITYQFGSIFSNIVNPRMGGSSGGGMVIMF